MESGPKGFEKEKLLEANINDILKIDGRWAQYVAGDGATEMTVRYLDEEVANLERLNLHDFDIQPINLSIDAMKEYGMHSIPDDQLEAATHSSADKGSLRMRGELVTRIIN